MKSQQGSSGRGPFFAPHPANQLSMEERRAYVTAKCQYARVRFPVLLEEMETLLDRFDPLFTLAVVATYALMRSPRYEPSRKDEPRVQQGHVEFLQAMALRREPRRDLDLAPPEDIQKIFDALPELFELQQDVRLRPEEEESDRNVSSDGGALKEVQEYLRARTAVVRNWGFFGAVTRIATEQFQLLDEEFKSKSGLKLTDIVRLFEHLMRRQERLVSAHWQKLRSAFSKKDVAGIVDRFFEVFPFSGDTEEWAKSTKAGAETTENAKAALLPLADRYLVQCFFLAPDSLAQELELDYAALKNLMDQLSLPLGSCNVPPKELFLNNPVWLKPFISLGDGQYFCAVPQTAMSFVYPIVDELLSDHPQLISRLASTRASYLEGAVLRLLAAGFPGADFRESLRWQHGGQEFETDLVMRFDTTLLLVEAKSGRVTWSALRGAPNRLVEHVKKLIVEPSEQSGRLASVLQQEIERRRSGAPPEFDFPLALDGVTAVVRLSVMLHDFATIQSVPTMLKEAGLLKNAYPLAPCMSLADLEIVLDLLEEPYSRLHYLRQRAFTLLSHRVVADEMDLLGFYLDTGLSFGGLEPGKHRMIATGYSQSIDRYYALLDEGIASKKPVRALTAWFRSLCEQISKRPTPGWSELTFTLLSVLPADQKKIERRVRKIAEKVRRGKPLPNGHDSIILTGPSWVNTALVFQVRGSIARERGAKQSENLASAAFEQGHVERCHVIVINPDAYELRYQGASVWYRTDRNVSEALFL